MIHSLNFGRVEGLRLTFAMLLLVASLTSQGCDYPLLMPRSPLIWGLVTHNGRPISDGFIRFIPDDPKSDEGMVAIGLDGTYRLTEDYRGRPLTTGWYRISIQPNRLTIPQRLNDKSVPTPNQTETSKSPLNGASNIEFSEIPLVYYEANTTPLKLWVRSQIQQVDIELRD